MRKKSAPSLSPYLVVFGLLATTVGLGLWSGAFPANAQPIAIDDQTEENLDLYSSDTVPPSFDQFVRSAIVDGEQQMEEAETIVNAGDSSEIDTIYQRKIQRNNPSNGPPLRKLNH